MTLHGSFRARSCWLVQAPGGAVWISDALVEHPAAVARVAATLGGFAATQVSATAEMKKAMSLMVMEERAFYGDVTAA